MQLGWVDFSKTERNKILNVLDLLGEQGVLDELGIASIRDGFANLFFPGTTTIQTRAKYFLIVPYIFKDLELNSQKDYHKLKKELNDKEQDCAGKFIDYGYVDGVIGRVSINNKKWVKRTPASIYWAGLRQYHIFKDTITIDQYLKSIAYRKTVKDNVSKLGNRNDNPDESDDKDAGNLSSIHFLNIPTYKKDWIENLDMALTKEEGAFLKEQIIKTCEGSLLSYILKENMREVLELDSFSDLNSLMFKFPEDIVNDYKRAKSFSDFVFVLRVLYNVIASDGKNKKANNYINQFKPHFKELSDVDLESIFYLLTINDIQLKSFLLKAQELMENEDIDALKLLIKNREISLKGENRSKTCHPGEFGDKWLAGGPLDYRFTVAKRIIKDIFESEEKEDDD